MKIEGDPTFSVALFVKQRSTFDGMLIAINSIQCYFAHAHTQQARIPYEYHDDRKCFLQSRHHFYWHPCYGASSTSSSRLPKRENISIRKMNFFFNFDQKIVFHRQLKVSPKRKLWNMQCFEIPRNYACKTLKSWKCTNDHRLCLS